MIRLPRLASNTDIVTADRKPTLQFSLDWNRAMEQIESTLNQLTAIPSIQAALLSLDAATAAATTAAASANAAAGTALGAAGTAQNAADTVTASSALANSYVTGLTITATDAGTSATVTISDHSRVYAYNPPTTVAVTGSTITGLLYETTYYIVYDDPSRAGGAVGYGAYTSANEAAQVNDRHSVGTVVTPAAAGAPAPGRPVAPPGGSYNLISTE